MDNFTNKAGVTIYTGDYIADPMNGGALRQIESIRDYGDGTACLLMDDGGVIGSDEVRHDNLRLESEA